MKQKLILVASVLMLIIVVIFMVNDMLNKPETHSNPYEYKLDSFKEVAKGEYCYQETKRFNADIDQLSGIAIDIEDNIYISGKNKILKYNKNLEELNTFDFEGLGRNLAISDDGKIFIGVENHIQILDKEGNKIISFKSYNDKSLITSIAIKKDKIYAADAGNKLVLVYNFDGNLTGIFGKKDSLSDRPGFIIPSAYFDVAIGRQGKIWAVNSGMHTLEGYNEEGRLISSWRKSSMKLDGFSGCCNPSHFTILSDGSYVTSEKGIVRIKIHRPDGSYDCVVAAPNEFNEKWTGLDLASNSNDDIFVIIPAEKEIRKYIRKK